MHMKFPKAALLVNNEFTKRIWYLYNNYRSCLKEILGNKLIKWVEPQFRSFSVK